MKILYQPYNCSVFFFFESTHIVNQFLHCGGELIMESSILIQIEEPTEYSTPQDNSSSECFYINFRYTSVDQVSLSRFMNSEMPVTTSFNMTFSVPRNILCNCDEFEVFDPDSICMTYLRNIFTSVPISSEVLDSILPFMGEYANDMIERNYEGLNILEMDVTVNVSNWHREDHEEIDRHHASTALASLVNSLDKVTTDDDASSWSTKQCAICLEEFCIVPDRKLVRTKCLHVFHEDCIAQWLQHCSTNQSYSCPLCRSQIS